MWLLNLVGLTMLMVDGGDAWWFINKRKTVIQPKTPIEDDCIQTALSGSCDFYRCLERRYPCHPHSFALEHGEFYCRRYRDNIDSFNERGREWVHSSQTCLTRALLAKYNMSFATCHDLNKVGWDNMSNCYLWEGFCSIAWENREALWDVFRLRDLTHSIRAWKELMDLAKECSGYNLNRFTQWALGKIPGLPFGIHG